MVSGYDRTETALTRELVSEGIQIFFEADENHLDKDADLVIYTPAIPKNNPILNFYAQQGYSLLKRSEALQQILEGMKCITIAGTHGKTTITTMVAHLLRSGGIGGSAFLVGISVNYQTNYWKEGSSNIAVVEADEYDRSFLKLSPDIAVLTAMDADHLDIYGTVEALREAFVAYTHNVKPEGCLWFKHGLPAHIFQSKVKHAYSLQNDAADAWAENIRMVEGGYVFDWKNKAGTVIEGLNLSQGGMHNVENAVVAIAVTLEVGLEVPAIRVGIESFQGVKRRFEYLIKSPEIVYIDDYAHHPKELEALIQSAKKLFPKRKCTVVFQPHLYSRTQDFADEFAESLSIADEVILLPIYPAREEPIPGVTSELIQKKMNHEACTLLSKEGLLQFVKEAPLELLITAGAGDIDKLLAPIKEILRTK
jgi:UDP-N-acetylmuramate--alanine ligase